MRRILAGLPSDLSDWNSVREMDHRRVSLYTLKRRTFWKIREGNQSKYFVGSLDQSDRYTGSALSRRSLIEDDHFAI